MAVIRKSRPSSVNTFLSGAASLEALRGNTNWGANWVFDSGGLQTDVLKIADTFSAFSTSGAYATDAEVSAVSGYIASGNIMNDVAHAMPSGGFYINASDGTGVYQVTVPSQCITGGSGYFVFTVA